MEKGLELVSFLRHKNITAYSFDSHKDIGLRTKMVNRFLDSGTVLISTYSMFKDMLLKKVTNLVFYGTCYKSRYKSAIEKIKVPELNVHYINVKI